MFAFLRPKTTFPPVQFADDVVIEQPAETVYGLIDWKSPNNAFRQRGSRIVPVDGEPDRFCMTMDELPGHRFDVFVIDAVPHASYGFGIIAAPMFGRMVKSHELYSLQVLSPGSCRLSLVNTVLFAPMRPQDMVHEELMVSAANHNALVKLKMQAEQGVDAVRAVADKLIV